MALLQAAHSCTARCASPGARVGVRRAAPEASRVRARAGVAGADRMVLAASAGGGRARGVGAAAAASRLRTVCDAARQPRSLLPPPRGAVSRDRRGGVRVAALSSDPERVPALKSEDGVNGDGGAGEEEGEVGIWQRPSGPVSKKMEDAGDNIAAYLNRTLTFEPPKFVWRTLYTVLLLGLVVRRVVGQAGLPPGAYTRPLFSST